MRISWILFIVLLVFQSFNKISGQSPHLFNYQTIVRDGLGNILSNQDITFRFSILKGNITGEAVYIETHAATTSSLGLANLKLGAGNNSTGSFNDIDWGSEAYYLKVELDIQNIQEFQEMGISQFLSVPYALYAENVKNVDSDWGIAGNNIYALNSGNVGIGLDSPIEKFHVAGNIRIEDTLKFKGIEDLQTGVTNPGQFLVGPKDILIGYAKDNLGNILIGNSQYGKTVFDLEMTGNGNIGIGTDVFNQTTTASSNVCLGLYSGYNLSSGSANVFLGSSAGEHISIGGTNVCIGSQSGNGRNGDKNIFIGNRAGYSWDGGGSDNIILGNYAGFAYNATNSGNIFLGKYAGYDVSTDNNVYIGPRNTGRDATGSKNIFLGYDVGLNYSGSNILLIDNKNDNVSPFIRGDMQNDQLEINGEMIVNGNSVVKSVNVETLINMNEMTEFPVLPMEGDLIYLNDTLRFFTGVSWKNLW